MPQSQSSARSTSPGSILLIEEYDALAAAICSALKKFAPHHAINVARNLGEAEALVASTNPALLIIDFDPAYPGLTEFLSRMRDVCPDARGLVMGGGVSDEIATEFRSVGALHFVEKPFELSDFGAAIQALLGPGSFESSHLPGSLRSLGLSDLVLAQCAGSRSVVLEVKSKNAKSGEIHVSEGQVVHAAVGKRKDGDALREMFGWPEARIDEVEGRKPARRTIDESWADLFFEAVREAKARRPAPVSPSVAPREKARSKTGKKLVVIDDTEMLLIFVEDTLSIADPELQITTALDGTTGINEIERKLPDLVLLDFSLPDINGDEVCRRLLENERTAGIPVLMMSGHVLEMTATAERFGNVVATISKPFLSDAFVALVQQTLSVGPRLAAKNIRAVETPKLPPAQPIAKARLQSVPKPTVSTPVAAPSSRPPPLPTPEPLKPMVATVTTTVPPQLETSRRSTIPAPVFSRDGNEVVLGLFLEVVSMQLTPTLRMGSIRAKPSSLIASLHVSPAALRAVLPVETGFELGRVEMDANGRITFMRLVPTLQPVQRLETRNALQIGALALVPYNSREHVQLTPAANAPMMMHLLAHFELAGVELSTKFQVAQLVLKSRSNTVQVTLSPEAVGQEQAGTLCETTAVRLDSSARITELLLSPLK